MTDGTFFGYRKPPSRRHADLFPMFDDIAERTYEQLIAHGNRVDQVFALWQEAEDELLQRAARRWSREFGHIR